MKTSTVLTVVFSVVLAGISAASEIGRADHALEANLKQAINQRHVHIHVHHGIVTLDGKVRTEQDRQALEALVRNTPGVVAVKDKLHVNFPTPAVTQAYPPTIPTSVPVYTAPPPVVTMPRAVVTEPTPVVVQEFPSLKVRAGTDEDRSAVHRIVSQLQADGVPGSGLENVTITVTNGNASLSGIVETKAARDALIAAVQRAGAVAAIYDQLQLR